MVRHSIAQSLHGPNMSIEIWSTDSLWTMYVVLFKTVQLVDCHRKDTARAQPCMCELGDSSLLMV